MRALLLALVILLSGCTGEAPAAEARPAGTSEAAPTPDPRIGEAAAPPNETLPLEEGLGGEHHAHDGWMGAERMNLLDADVAFTRWLDGTTFARFTPDKTLVLEGTAHIELTFSAPERSACSILTLNDIRPCTPPVADPSPPTLTLRFQHASTTEWLDAGPIPWDAPLVIPLENVTWTDMPHSGASLWAFEIHTPEPDHATLRFHVRVDILRGPGEIPRWPGHPDFYAESPEREVLRGSGLTDYPGPHADWPTLLQNALSIQRLIPSGTRELHVHINITNAEGPPGLAPAGWELAYADATGAWHNDLPDRAADEPLRWAIPIDQTQMDSPYAEASRWKILLLGQWRAPVPFDNSFTGFTPYKVHYEAVAIASALGEDA